MQPTALLSATVLLLFACVAPPAQAADDQKATPLTAKEIEEGWILLFDGESTFGWKTEGSVQVKDGILHVGGEKGGSLQTTTRFNRGVIRCTYQQGGQLQAEMTWRGGKCMFGGPTWSNMTFHPDGADVSEVAIIVPAKTELRIRSLGLKPGDMQPIFNGKDLSGWKPFEGDANRQKSKFIVTPEGWLNVREGPGDLQTEGKYDDFILQFDCISNGKALNSGVFFRCIPGQYQNGYEAQIQNGFKDGDRTKPADFGTGAIYRRVPARKVIPNDHEWFTMTVAAQGRHIATWVNGYQTVDWTDNRPPKDNPRNGSKTGKGHISIQGHDPTTDLSFRNIRIAELPK